MTEAYPLAWPEGWPRAEVRKDGHFGVTSTRYNEDPGGHSYTSRSKRSLSIEEGIKRVRYELGRLDIDVRDDVIISTNLKLNMSGLPRGNQGEPHDPGVAIYWQKPDQPTRVMAIDAYYRVADNLGAIAATLEAMRAIERHGGAQILDRAFTGFTALPAPKSCWDILRLRPGVSVQEIRAAWRRLVAEAHPDRGGSEARAAELNAARDAALKQSAA